MSPYGQLVASYRKPNTQASHGFLPERQSFTGVLQCRAFFETLRYQTIFDLWPFKRLFVTCITAFPQIVTVQLFQIRFLGGKLGEAIANEYDVSTVGDLL